MANFAQKEVAEEVVRRYFKSRLAFVETSVKSSSDGPSISFSVSGKPGDLLEFLQSYGVGLERSGEENVEDFTIEIFGDLMWKLTATVIF
ncbi:hypothetical protein P10VF_153 [Rhizobium phage vB_RleM_P10VF]|uniref:Uncharacterized protein n=1 Tax=Rhizobium phage vB_RleM_P10VF TaxID=1527770 RepID=A0A076YQA0_9CAUD|nr:hypothetical protein P10VF_153 [Rhizobium phage vB_RleM_P10VF]AIK68366.1 hypothetical protein P10VF_153 [Rhizobium phage vB_RleM_P10VF]